MHCIDHFEQTESSLKLDGWYFKYGSSVKEVIYKSENQEFSIGGYGRESADIASIYGDSYARARFLFEIEGGDRNGLIVFRLEDGTTEGIRLDGGEDNELIEPLRHQLAHGKYLGLFELKGVDSIEGVSISVGDKLDSEAMPVVGYQTEIKEATLAIDISVEADPTWNTDNICVHFNLGGGRWETIGNIPIAHKKRDPAHLLVKRFIEWVNTQEDGLTILEIGSRARSGIVRSSQFKKGHRYIGIDALRGENVDIVCDAHTMSENLEAESIDVVVSYAVFEHLAMPWKVALEMNKVMKKGGRCMILAPHAWPLHETPFDFWRFSEDTWRVLFNRSTGFKLLDAKNGEPAMIEPQVQMQFYDTFKAAPAYLCSVMVAEKTHDTELSWDVPVEDVYKGVYPV